MRTTKSGGRAPAGSNHAPNTAGTAPRIARGGRPTKREAEELGSRILDTAADLFATQGFTATSMEQVAIACGAGKDTIYRRYASKAALFSGIMERLHAKLLPELDRVMSSEKKPLDKLHCYARTLLSINLRPEFLALNRVALGEAMPFGGVKPIPTHKDPVMERFTILVEDAQLARHVIDGDAYFIAEQLLYSTSIKPMIATMIGDSRFADPSEQDRYFETAWVQFLAGAAPRDGHPSDERAPRRAETTKPGSPRTKATSP